MPADAYSREMQGTRLRQLATAAGYPEMAKFARAAGIEPGTADKHVQREKVPTHAAEKYIHAARHTGASVEWLLYGKGKAPAAMSAPVPNHELLKSPRVTTSPVDTAYVFVPLWRVRVSTTGGRVLIAETNESVLAPSELRNSNSSFGLQVWDDANAPWLRRGSMLFVDPVRIPADGQWCVLASQVEEDGATLYSPILGILAAIEGSHWILQRGSRREKYAMAEWPLAFLVAYTRPS